MTLVGPAKECVGELCSRQALKSKAAEFLSENVHLPCSSKCGSSDQSHHLRSVFKMYEAEPHSQKLWFRKPRVGSRNLHLTNSPS